MINAHNIYQLQYMTFNYRGNKMVAEVGHGMR